MPIEFGHYQGVHGMPSKSDRWLDADGLIAVLIVARQARHADEFDVTFLVRPLTWTSAR